MKKALKIILGILFFPIAVYVLIWKNKKMKNAVKIILTVIWTMFVVVGCAGFNTDEPEVSDEQNKTSEVFTTKPEETAAEITAEPEQTTEPPVTTAETEAATSEPPAVTTEAETTLTEAPETEPSTEAETAPETEATLPKRYKLEYNNCIDVVYNEIDGRNVVVIKSRHTADADKKSAKRCFYDVEDLIQNQGLETFDEIQYWTVKDLGDGDVKLVAFTVNKDTIQKIYNKQIAVSEYEKYVDDLWVHPGLK